MERPDMSAKMPKLTLIVAVTPSFGIGRAGTLPWPRIKSEMAYFARVTKRAPAEGRKNAVIMGRKTWESIPSKFRPLPGRINVIISRQGPSLDLGVPEGAADEVYASSSLQESLGLLRNKHQTQLGRVFVIGGAQIYGESLGMPEADKVLLTRIKQDYECDTFFPIKFGSSDDNARGWTKAPDNERDEWMGEEGTGGDEWTVELWTRE